MTNIQLGDLERIGLSAAQDVVGPGVEEVEVRLGVDHEDREAYFITYRFHHEHDRDRAGTLRIRLSHRIRDALIEHGDERYPYVRVLADKDWAFRGNAGSA